MRLVFDFRRHDWFFVRFFAVIFFDNLVCVLTLDGFKISRVNRFCEIFGRSIVAAYIQKIVAATWLLRSVVDVKIGMTEWFWQSNVACVNDCDISAKIIIFLRYFEAFKKTITHHSCRFFLYGRLCQIMVQPDRAQQWLEFWRILYIFLQNLKCGHWEWIEKIWIFQFCHREISFSLPQRKTNHVDVFGWSVVFTDHEFDKLCDNFSNVTNQPSCCHVQGIG